MPTLTCRNAKQFITTAATVAFMALMMVTSAPQLAPAQSALITSGAQRGAAGTARLSAMTQQLGIRLGNLEVCNKKGLVYDKDAPLALRDGDDCVVGANPCGDDGMLYGPNHPNALPSGCVPDFKVETDGTVTFTQLSDHTAGAKLGEPTLCDGTTATEGTLRYKTIDDEVQICDDTGTWVALGGGGGGGSCWLKF